MALRAFAGLFLLLSLPWLIPFGVLAEDLFLPETAIEVPELETEIVSGSDIPEEPVPLLDEELVPEPLAQVILTSSNEDEEPELIFDCEIQHDSNGNETERCGLGYYRTLCGYNAGVEECVTFFEFSEEPEPPPLSYDIENLRSREYITLSLSWNGVPLPEGNTVVPFETPGMLGWSYNVSLPEHHGLPYTYQSTYTELLAAATLTLQIYEGPIGEATLVYSEEVPHGGSGVIPFSFAAFSEYRIILSATFSPDLNVPGYECGGELCPVFEPRIESLTWFMEHGAAIYDEIYNEIDEANHFIEHGVQKTRMSTFKPLVSGMREIGTTDVHHSVSNVLFLPGIKGSRLYRPTDSCNPDISLSCLGVKLWEPSGNVLLRDLFLNESGGSGRSDIYVREGDIVSEVLGNNFYASFVNQMNALTGDGTLAAWKPIAYDWRLSLDDIVNNGVKRGEKIYYQESTETPYIEQSLKELAAASPTGKVSIVAHSNGGLVAKRLVQRLEENGEADLIDQIIFVGVPQSGAPQAMAGLLYGYGEALPFDQCSQDFLRGWLCSLLGSRDVARELAEHSPMAFHLLPSQAYFDQVESPVAAFTATSAYLEERNRYGTHIDSLEELYDFLQAKDGGRVKPAVEDVKNANVLSANFLNYARTIHESLDEWEPPSGVRVHQIAGWGMNTIAGVEFYEQKKLFGGYKEMYRPIFVEDGDRVVPVPSALLMSAGDVENYWVNLEQARTGLEKFDHSNLFEIESVRVLLRNILVGTVGIPSLITTTQPVGLGGSEKLIFFLHSPLSLEIYDQDGNHVGETSDGSFDEEIPGVEYGEFGDVKYIIAPSGEYDVVLRGKDSGVFTLDVQVMSENEVTSSFTLAEVPTSAKTIATIKVSTDLAQTTSLRVDEDGDGTVDFELLPEQNKTIIFEPEILAIETSERSSRSSRTRTQSVSPFASTTVTDVSESFSEPPQTIRTVSTADEMATTETTDKSVSNNPSLVSEEIVPAQTQTASVYDAIGSDLINWLGEVLYNFWDAFVKIFTSLFSKK